MSATSLRTPTLKERSVAGWLAERRPLGVGRRRISDEAQLLTRRRRRESSSTGAALTTAVAGACVVGAAIALL